MTVNSNGEAGLRTALILYGSETGNAQDVAEELGRLVERLHFLTRVSDMNSVDIVWITLVSCSLSVLYLLTSLMHYIVYSFSICIYYFRHFHNRTRRSTLQCRWVLEEPSPATATP